MEMSNIRSRILNVLSSHTLKGDIVTVDYFMRFIDGCTYCELFDALESLVKENVIGKEIGGFLRHYPGYRIHRSG